MGLSLIPILTQNIKCLQIPNKREIMPRDPSSVIAASVGLILLAVSIYFFVISLSLMMKYDVTSSLLAALIGFTTLSASITILKSWIIAKAAKREEK